MNQRLYFTLERDEGVRAEPYYDTASKLTVGVGRNLADKGVTFLELADLLSAVVTGKELLQALGDASVTIWKGRVQFTVAEVFNQLIPAGGLTELMIRQLLENDVDEVVSQLESEFPLWESYSDVRKEVLVNVLFNLGLGTFRRFKKMNDAIDRGDWNEASVEMLDSRAARQTGQRYPRLAEALRNDDPSPLEG